MLKADGLMPADYDESAAASDSSSERGDRGGWRGERRGRGNGGRDRNRERRGRGSFEREPEAAAAADS